MYGRYWARTSDPQLVERGLESLRALAQAADTGRFGSIRGGLGTKFAFVPKLDRGLLRQESPDGEVDSTRTESTDLTDASTRRSPRRGFVAWGHASIPLATS